MKIKMIELTNLNFALFAAALLPPARSLGATSTLSIASERSLPSTSEASESLHGFFFLSPFFVVGEVFGALFALKKKKHFKIVTKSLIYENCFYLFFFGSSKFLAQGDVKTFVSCHEIKFIIFNFLFRFLFIFSLIFSFFCSNCF